MGGGDANVYSIGWESYVPQNRNIRATASESMAYVSHRGLEMITMNQLYYEYNHGKKLAPLPCREPEGFITVQVYVPTRIVGTHGVLEPGPRWSPDKCITCGWRKADHETLPDALRESVARARNRNYYRNLAQQVTRQSKGYRYPDLGSALIHEGLDPSRGERDG